MHPLTRNRSFLRLLVGRLTTNAGDSIYYVAALWLVHHLGGSPLYTGLASFLVLAPNALQFAVGPLVDSLSVRTSLVVTQAAQGLLVAAIPIADAMGALSVELVLVVVPVASLLNQVTYPAQSSALPRAVADDQLATANSVFNAAHEGVNMTFNAVGGLLVGIAAVGAVGAFAVDVATFALAIVLFAGLSLPERDLRSDADDPVQEPAATADSTAERVRARTREYVGDFRDGIAYLRGTAFLHVVLPQTLVSFATGMMLAVLPAYAALRGGPGLYGILLSALAAGALVGSILAARLDGVPYGYLLILGTGVTALAWTGAAVSTWTPAIVAFFALAIVFPGTNSVLFDTLVQSVAPEDYIGRVASSTGTLKNVATPVGSLVGGAVAALVGPVPILGIVAVANLLVMGYFVAFGAIRSLPPVRTVEREDARIEEFV